MNFSLLPVWAKLFNCLRILIQCLSATSRNTFWDPNPKTSSSSSSPHKKKRCWSCWEEWQYYNVTAERWAIFSGNSESRIFFTYKVKRSTLQQSMLLSLGGTRVPAFLDVFAGLYKWTLNTISLASLSSWLKGAHPSGPLSLFCVPFLAPLDSLQEPPDGLMDLMISVTIP